MGDNVFFDHIEVHVRDVPAYCEFLRKAFRGGRAKTISDSGTSMFISDGGLRIEVKKRAGDAAPCAAGFCNPCLRMEGARSFIEKTLGFPILKTVENPEGRVYFFQDHEGVVWHFKDYLELDKSVNW